MRTILKLGRAVVVETASGCIVYYKVGEGDWDTTYFEDALDPRDQSPRGEGVRPVCELGRNADDPSSASGADSTADEACREEDEWTSTGKCGTRATTPSVRAAPSSKIGTTPRRPRTRRPTA